MGSSGREKNESGGIVRMTKSFMNLVIVILIAALAAVIAIKAYQLGYEITSYKPSTDRNAQDVEIIITADMSVRDVGNLLIEKGLIDESLPAFLIQERLSDYHDKFIPGTYQLNPTQTVEMMLETISTPEEE